MTIRRVLLATIAVLALHAAPALAVQCGDTIGPRQVAVLDADLTCPVFPGDAALTLAGGTLDLNGHTLKCDCVAGHCFDVSISGVRVDGDKSVLRDRGTTPGLITGCPIQVEIRAKKVTVEDIHTIGGVVGFQVQPGAEKALLRRNVATGVPVGFRIRGDGARVLRNEARETATAGFSADSSNNAFRFNLVEDDAIGLFTSGFSLLGEASNNEIKFNTVRGKQVGIGIFGALHKVKRNVATGNGRGIILGEASGVKVTRNTVTGNDVGITALSAATSNLIRRNTATGNAELDLEDDDPHCLSNTWSKNEHTTKSPDCIE